MIVWASSALVQVRNSPAHLVLQILAHGNRVAQSLSPPSLEHQIPSQTLSCRGLEWPELDRCIGRISRHSLPMIKSHLTECLPESRRPEIRLEAIRIEHGDKCLDSVKWGSWFGNITRDVTSASGEDSVDCCYAVCGSLDFDIVHWLEETRGGLKDIR